jgi:ketosteroid isomerase-like protein
MSKENVEIVRGLFELWDRGDRWAGLDSFDPGIEVVVATRRTSTGPTEDTLDSGRS